ncbi:unnamed protein product [Cuscuta epithymum]|uniref:CCHC-type domain-containing protein n=1 Tax=Cuscuta epithymum TaxID=186058 RepID=A0AAV0DTB5_9ASTE|nr:unnamed protein product [Cuscuta epithymum]
METEELENQYAGLKIVDDDIAIDFLEQSQTDVVDDSDRTSWSMVGRFLTDKPIRFDKMLQVMASIWRPSRGVDATELQDNLFQFDFYHEKELLRVLEDGPWAFENSTLVCKQLEPPDANPLDVKLDSFAIWMQIHNLPATYASEHILEQIGNFAGSFMYQDPLNFGRSKKSYYRVRILLDVSKPLQQKMKIRKRDGSLAWITLMYERLNTFCFFCGIMGHQVRYCSKILNVNITPDEYSYGPWLRANLRRNAPTIGNRWIGRQPPPVKDEATEDTSGEGMNNDSILAIYHKRGGQHERESLASLYFSGNSLVNSAMSVEFQPRPRHRLPNHFYNSSALPHWEWEFPSNRLPHSRYQACKYLRPRTFVTGNDPRLRCARKPKPSRPNYYQGFKPQGRPERYTISAKNQNRNSSRENFKPAQKVLVQRPGKSACSVRPVLCESEQPGDLDEAWHMVKHRNRRYYSHQRNPLDFEYGNANRFCCLDLDDEYPKYLSLLYAFDREKENGFHPYSHPNTFHRHGGHTKSNWYASRSDRRSPARHGRNQPHGFQNRMPVGNQNSTHEGGKLSRKLTQRPAVSSPIPSPTVEPVTMEEITSHDTLAEGMGQGHEGDGGHHSGNLQQKSKNLTWADLLKNDRGTHGLTIGNKESAAPSLPVTPPQKKPLADSILLIKDNYPPSPSSNTQLVTTTPSNQDSEKFSFFGEIGFDSIQIDSRIFKFAVKENEIFILQFQKSRLHKISFNSQFAPQIVRFISQLTGADHCNDRQRRRFGIITIATELNKSGRFLKIAKKSGGFILIPMGPHNKELHDFLAIFSNFVGLTSLVQEEPTQLEHETIADTEESTSISKLIFNFEVQRAYAEKHQPPTEKQSKLALVQAYSDASDSFDPSDDSHFSDDFLGHATECDRRPPISGREDIRDSEFNSAICYKSQFITLDNCILTDNLNTQLKLYKKSQKNKRRHSMRTRSQSKQFPWA